MTLLRCRLPLILFLLAQLHGLAVLAQEADALPQVSISDTTAGKAPERQVGFWAAVYAEPAYLPHSGGINTGLAVALVYRKQLLVGAYLVEFQSDYRRLLIFPNEFRFSYSHIGAWVGYITKMNRPFQITGDFRVGEGKVFWEKVDTFYSMFEDYALFVQSAVGVDMKLLRNFFAHAEVGYRSVISLNLPEATGKELSGISFNLMLKLRVF